MPRVYPPPYFRCPYKDYCPHMDGLSIKWVWGSYQRTYKEHCEHWRVRDIQQERISEVLSRNAELEKENEQLRAKLKALHQKQFKANCIRDPVKRKRAMLGSNPPRDSRWTAMQYRHKGGWSIWSFPFFHQITIILWSCPMPLKTQPF